MSHPYHVIRVRVTSLCFWSTPRSASPSPVLQTVENNQVLLGKFTTLVRTTKDDVALPCYCRRIKKQVFSNPQPEKTPIYLKREGQTPPWEKLNVGPFCLFSDPDAASTFSHGKREPIWRQPKDSHLEIPQNG
ncbi:hypothetical protein J6590_048113 [Homalodisca vitripennis]|nr:hypothetical protein J6590_048113 [Homalodisca vitripennis]